LYLIIAGSHMKDGLVDTAGETSLKDAERWLRKVRIGLSVMVVVAAASLVASMMLYPVSVTFVLTALFFGGLLAVGMSFRRRTDVGIFEGILFGVFYIGWSFLRDLLFPSLSGNLFTIFWTGTSAWVLGFSLLALPLMRFSIERKRKAVQTDQASVRQYRDSGDSAFVAQMRTSAGKMPKGYMITMIAMGAAMAGLGMYTWLFEDFFIGLLLAVMMVPPIAMFAWMLKLRGGTLR
jgi:hypothetical protein